MKAFQAAAVVVLGLASAGAWAVDWQPVDENSKFLMDIDSFADEGFGEASVWIMRNEIGIWQGKKHKSIQTLLRFKCRSRESGAVAVYFFSGKDASGALSGKITRKPALADYSPIPPGSIGDALLKVSCDIAGYK